LRDHLAVEHDFAGRGRKEALDEIEERGFAGAVRPNDRAQFTRRDRQ
jgi:hypothetical protein